MSFDYLLNIVVNLFYETEFLSAIAGAIVGGLISFIMQFFSFYEARKQRISEITCVKETLAHSTMIKLLRIVTNLYHINKIFQDTSEALKKNSTSQSHKSEPWQVWMPISNLPKTIGFTPEELSLFLSLKEIKFFNKIIDIDNIHNTKIEAVDKLNILKEYIIKDLPIHKYNDGIFESLIDDNDYKKLLPKTVQFNMLYMQILDCIKDDLNCSENIIKDFFNITKEKLNIELSISKIQ